jgi:two-component system, OmpR family, sensor kinase
MKLPLRTRLLAVTLALTVTGLAVAGFATYHFLRVFMIHRVDQQLAVLGQGPAQNALQEQFTGGHPDMGGPLGVVPANTWCAFVDGSGRVLLHTPLASLGTVPPAPSLPTALPLPGSGTRFLFFTTSSAGPRYRVMALAATEQPNNVPGTLVVAIPLTEVTATLHRLVFLELTVALFVLLAVGSAGWWLIRRGLRPLDRMAETADEISAGELSRRVEPDEEETEVGRLGHALNVMLGRIEASFAEQRESEERLRRFIADASHELRTPITSIRGYAELFRHGAAARPHDLERAMRRIEDEGARMGVLVEDLLLLARLDQGRPVDRDPVDLRTLVGDAADDARAIDPAREITLSVAEEAVFVAGDEPRLRQVLANLLENARVHTPPETPVEVRLRRSGDEAVIEVADRGPGLSDGEASHVFERFYRGDPSRSRSSGGTGLGLSIASALIEAHGGRIEVASTPGEGATFTITLPVVPAPVAVQGFKP